METAPAAQGAVLSAGPVRRAGGWPPGSLTIQKLGDHGAREAARDLAFHRAEADMPMLEPIGPDGDTAGRLIDRGNNLNVAIHRSDRRVKDITSIPCADDQRVRLARQLHHEVPLDLCRHRLRGLVVHGVRTGATTTEMPRGSGSPLATTVGAWGPRCPSACETSTG